MPTNPHLSNQIDPPSDNTTLTEVIGSYREAGFVVDFFAEEDGRVRCGHCNSVLAADQLTMQSMRRMEGASDPADMLSVVATTCPVCGADGTMVLGYGPNASEGDAHVSRALSDRRTDPVLPPDAPPAEMPDA
jgi:hypothetical protein